MSAATSAPAFTTTAAITASKTSGDLLANLSVAARHGANDVPLVARAIASLDPDLAAQIAGKSALGSRTVWSGLIVHLLTWAVGYWKLDWDAATTEALAGGISYLILLGLRFVTKRPITSFLPQSVPAVPPVAN